MIYLFIFRLAIEGAPPAQDAAEKPAEVAEGEPEPPALVYPFIHLSELKTRYFIH